MKELQKLVDDGVTLDKFIEMSLEYNKTHSKELEDTKVCPVHEYAGLLNNPAKKQCLL